MKREKKPMVGSYIAMTIVFFSMFCVKGIDMIKNTGTYDFESLLISLVILAICVLGTITSAARAVKDYKRKNNR